MILYGGFVAKVLVQLFRHASVLAWTKDMINIYTPIARMLSKTKARTIIDPSYICDELFERFHAQK